MSLHDIIVEWEAACFYSDELLAEAYSTALERLRTAPLDERRDSRLHAFLKAGYLAFLREKSKANKQDALIHEVALRLANPPLSAQLSRLARQKRLLHRQPNGHPFLSTDTSAAVAGRLTSATWWWNVETVSRSVSQPVSWVSQPAATKAEPLPGHSASLTMCVVHFWLLAVLSTIADYWFIMCFTHVSSPSRFVFSPARQWVDYLFIGTVWPWPSRHRASSYWRRSAIMMG